MPNQKHLHSQGDFPGAEDTPFGSSSDAITMHLVWAVNDIECFPADARKASKLVQGLLKEDADFAAGCLRLCIHDAFAFDAKKRVYGVNASIR